VAWTRLLMKDFITEAAQLERGATAGASAALLIVHDLEHRALRDENPPRLLA